MDMSKSAAQQHHERVESLAAILREAPRVPGASQWYSMAYRLIEAGYHNEEPLTVVIQPQPNAQVPAAIIEQLKRLQSVASQNKRGRAETHETRKAGDDLARYAVSVMERYGVGPAHLSVKMGLSKGTLGNFLERRGVLKSRPATATSKRGSLPEAEVPVEEIPHVVWQG
jgi:hypothetical protein